MALADHPPSLLSRAVRRIILWIFRAKGWTATGQAPTKRRFVMIAAPHTSNWDFVLFLGVTERLGIRPHFMAKNSLFKWPMQRFMLDMGGVPVDRTSSHDYVEQMIGEFTRRNEFMLALGPEGTRGGVKRWKSGFYHIAHGAKVPIQLAFVDNENRVAGFGPLIEPSGDYKADMAKILSFYRSTVPNFTEPEL